METQATRPVIGRNAAFAVIWPIAGMMGGLLIGVLRAKYLGLLDLGLLTCVIKWSVTGFFAGLGAVVLLALQFRGRDVVSIGRLMAVVAVAGVVAWFFSRVFFDAIGFGGF